MKNVDLHTHSNYSSDSDVSPEELIIEAKKVGLKYIAITDHDSVDGVSEALKAGVKHKINVIPGVELHSKFGEILGYFIDPKNSKLLGLCKRNKKALGKRALKIIKLLNKDGYNIDLNLMKEKYSVEILERPMIAKELVNNDYADSFRDAFDRFIGEGKKYYVEADFLSTKNVIKIIASAGGVAVLSHPYYEDYASEFRDIKILIDAGLVGIECTILPKEIQPKNYKEIIRKTKKLAKKYNLILTGGSDYHGSIHPYNKLGKHGCEESVIHNLKRKLKK